MRVLLVALHLIVGLSAIGAGLVLAREPSGETLTFKREWLEGSPFSDYRIPGIFLLLVIAPMNLISAITQTKKHKAAPALTTLSGVVLILWIAIQTAIIGFRHWSQGLWAVIFSLIAMLGFGQLIRRDRA
jgi:hypothetical protein